MYLHIRYLTVYNPQKDNYGGPSVSNYRYKAARPKSTSAVVKKREPIVDTGSGGLQSLRYHSTSAANSEFSENIDDDDDDFEEPPLKFHKTEEETAEDEDDADAQIRQLIDYDENENENDVDVDDEVNEQVAEEDEDYKPNQSINRKPSPLKGQKSYIRRRKQKNYVDPLTQQNTSANNLRQRKERMSKQQKEVYVRFLKKNPQINELHLRDVQVDPIWRKLSEILNAVPGGAVKNVREWKQTFDNWRYRIFQYARYNSQLSEEEVAFSKTFRPLTDTDKRACAIWISYQDTAPPDLDKLRFFFDNFENFPE